MAATPSRNICTLICLVLALGTTALYWPITSHPFILYDDEQYVLNNPHVTSGLSWTNTVWAFKSGEAANWHPLTWITHQMDCSLYGVKAGGHHLTNLLFHVVNTLLVFFFLRGTTGTLWRAAFVAALFGWHPLHVESVAWASERKDVLSTFFWLLTLTAYVRYARTPNRAAQAGFYGLSLILFACGLMSKPMVVTLPCVLLLLDLWPLYRFRFSQPPVERGGVTRTSGIGWLVLEKIPFLCMAVVGSYVTFLVQTDAGAVWATPWYERIANALIAYARYVLKVFSPTDLAIVYSHPKHWPFSLTLSAAILLILWTVPILIYWRRHPVYFVGWFWFLGTLVPTIGIIQVGAQSMADRYMYIPSIGFFIVVVWAWIELAARFPQRRNLSMILAGAALAACMAATAIQINYWRNSTALFLHAIAASPDNYIAANCLGKAFEKNGDLPRALVMYKNSVELEPRFPQSQFNYAMCLMQVGRSDESIQHLKLAADMEPNDPDIQLDLGLYFAQHGSFTNSFNCFSNVVHLRPDFATGHFNYGCTLADLGQLAGATAQFREALRLQPGLKQAQDKLNRLLQDHPELNPPPGRQVIVGSWHPGGLVKNCAPVKQSIVTLDMEGVLTPEIWIAVSEKTKIPELRRTTRDEPDYDKLMRYRIGILDQHGIKLSDIQTVIGSLSLLDGSRQFLDELRTLTQVIILSDTFEQFAQPLIRQLNWPTLLCHRLIVENDRITDYQLRIPDQKRKAVAALKSLNYHVISAGDSFNDTGMLTEAHDGFLIHAPKNVKEQFPQFPAVESHAELLKLIKGVL